MMALEWMQSTVWSLCTSPHCDVMEKQSNDLLDKVLLLQALDQQDELRLTEEQTLCRLVHERLDKLKERMESTLKNKERAFEVLSKHETELLERLDQVKRALALSFSLHMVLEAVGQLEAQYTASLQKEAKL